MTLLLAFAVAFAIAWVLTPFVRRFAISVGAIDHPDGGVRKVHTKPVSYLGGLPIFAAFVIPVIVLVPPSRELVALLLGGLIVVVVGAIDDVRGVRPTVRLAWQVIAAMVVLAGGIGIYTVTNPFGGQINLDWGRFVVDLGVVNFHITPVANALSMLWIVGMINAINFLDGLDGLATGVSSIAALVLFALTIGPEVDQPGVALLAIILAGAALGFLPHNFFPAKIFLGDAGAYFLGLTLALLAIYSGGKLATAGLVLGFVIIDALWVTIRRIRRGKHPFTADREHLHHLLMAAGLSHRTVVLVLYLLAGTFGFVALVSSTSSKLVALVALFGLMVVLLTGLSRLVSRKA